MTQRNVDGAPTSLSGTVLWGRCVRRTAGTWALAGLCPGLGWQKGEGGTGRKRVAGQERAGPRCRLGCLLLPERAWETSCSPPCSASLHRGEPPFLGI